MAPHGRVGPRGGLLGSGPVMGGRFAWDIFEDVRNETIKHTAISDKDEIRYGEK